MGRNIDILIPERFRKNHNNALFDYSANVKIQSLNAGSDLLALRKDRSEIPVEVNLSPFESNGIKYISIAVRDVSERRKANIALKISEKRNRIFIEQSPNAIAMYDTDMRMMAASKKWISDYKLEGKEIIGHTHYEIFPEIGEDWKKIDRKSTRLNSSHLDLSRMPSSA